MGWWRRGGRMWDGGCKRRVRVLVWSDGWLRRLEGERRGWWKVERAKGEGR